MRATMTEVQVLREVVKKVVPMITGRGVRVTQMGSQAFVQHDSRTGKTVRVNIPHIADDADSKLILAIQGFIDHECGHVLDTDWKAVTAGEKVGREIAEEQKIDPKRAAERVVSLNNIVEDPFVERCMQKRFPGTAFNLERLYGVFLNRMTIPALEKCENDADRLSVLIVPIVRSLAGQRYFTDFLDKGGYWDEPLVKAFVDRVSPTLRKEIATVKTSWDSLDCATQLYHILYPPPPIAPPAKEPEDCKGEGEGEGKSEEPGDGTSEPSDGEESDETRMSETPPPPPEDTPPETEEDAADAPPEEEPAPEEAEPEAPPAGDDLDDAGGEEEAESDEADPETGEDVPAETEPEPEPAPVDEAEGKPEEKKPEPEEKKVEAGSDAADEDKDEAEEASAGGESVEGEAEEPKSEPKPEPSPFDGLDMGPIKDMAEAIAEMITDEATRETRGADYRVYTKEWDVIEPLEVGAEYNPDWLVALDSKTRHMVAPMQKDIERMMAARSQVVKVPGFRSGRLHGGSLHRLSVNDDRVFRRVQENNSKATAVSLVVDNSGSMGGHKQETAMAAAYALSQTLERVGIKHEVIGFTTLDVGSHRSEISKEESRIGTSYSRTEPLYMPIYKGYDERLNSNCRARFAKGFGGADYLNQNVDGECVSIACQRLLQQREPRRVMLVLSDGSPACLSRHGDELHSDLHRAVADAKKMGIEMIGIGIRTNAVKTYYPKHIIIDSVDELPKVVMGELKRILVSGDR